MNNSKIPILLTSSVVAHDQGVKLKDTSDRIRLAIESVVQWMKLDPKLQIILCDGSGFDFSSIVKRDFPEAQIECLVFENDQEMVRQFGRGYGEGEIVRFALQNSFFIKKAGCFAKCSSKLWVHNYYDYIASWNGYLLCKGVFKNIFSLRSRAKLSYIDTRFYVASRDAYEKYFLNVHFNIDVQKGYGLEDCFFDAFKSHGIMHALSPVSPIINGVGGGTGMYYKNTKLRILKDKFKLNWVRHKSVFEHLFACRQYINQS